MRQIFILTLLSILVASLGCNKWTEADKHGLVHPNSTNTNSWNPKTENLDLMASVDRGDSAFVKDIKSFYENLHNKNWEAAYEQRSEAFKYDLPLHLYLDWAKKEGQDWALVDYEVLTITFVNQDYAELICRFDVLPGLGGSKTTYANVIWHKEADGHWRCDAAGPDRLSIFKFYRIRPTK